METDLKLVMSFKTSGDKKVSISISDPRNDVTEEEIKATMDLIVSQNIFAPNGTNLVEALGAKVVRTNTTDYDLVVE